MRWLQVCDRSYTDSSNPSTRLQCWSCQRGVFIPNKFGLAKGRANAALLLSGTSVA